MSDSVVRMAGSAFARGAYEEALVMYEKAARLYGTKNFQANIVLCQKRIAAKKSKNGETNKMPPLEQTVCFPLNAISSANSHSYDDLLALARSLPVSNGSRLLEKIPVRVGIITDIFMFNFYRDAFSEVHYLSPANYEQVMDARSLDLVMYVTCWRGLNNEEWRGVKFRSQPAEALEGIVKRARANDIKLVFQSIEDPSNFEYFLPIAKKFDYIFTTDADSVERYKVECGHEHVFYGEYGVNPRINNPIGCRRHVLNAAFFAGSWNARYKARCEDMETVFDSIMQSGGELLIVDRNYGTGSNELQYPERFRDCVRPPVEHELLQSMHKLFRYNLNFNSIKDSPTMCAMRAYELQAMGVGIISNYARSVYNNFPEIRIVPWRMDLSREFGSQQDLEEYRRNMAMVRNVMNDKTSRDIALRLIEAIGFKGENIRRCEPKVCIIIEAHTAEVIRSVRRQRYMHCVPVTVAEIDTEEKWVAFARENNVDYFTWFAGSDEYEADYLTDLVNAFKYTNARYVTRLAWFRDGLFEDGPQHEFTETIGGKARTLFAACEFSPLQFLEAPPHEKISNVPGGYAIDPFELNYKRYISKSNAANSALPPRLSVVVPVYNNGRFLLAKCVSSLKRNRMWPEIEVLLIDDGSTEEETVRIVEELAQEHKNIRAFFFRDGGSGSASRPRNKGIELAAAPLISFLDPDNEISPCGYDALVDLYEESVALRKGDIDFVAGYHVKVEAQAKTIGKHAGERLCIVEDMKKRFLESGKFPVVPTQPAVIHRRLFLDGKLRFVEGAAGQDTLFGWALLCHAKAAVFTDVAYLVYYAQRAGSIVNAIDATYFEKKLILERAQSEFLARHGLKEAYKSYGYERFMREWYLPKLKLVRAPSERSRCLAILEEIARLYERKLPVEALE